MREYYRSRGKIEIRILPEGFKVARGQLGFKFKFRFKFMWRGTGGRDRGEG
jgi:hypothetical protein